MATKINSNIDSKANKSELPGPWYENLTFRNNNGIIVNDGTVGFYAYGRMCVVYIDIWLTGNPGVLGNIATLPFGVHPASTLAYGELYAIIQISDANLFVIPQQNSFNNIRIRGTLASVAL